MRISGAAECQGDCGAIEPTKPTTGMKWRLSIFEVALAVVQARSGTSSAEIPYCGYKERQPAGSIGLCDGSYCRRADSAAAVGSGQQIANMAWRSNDNLGRSIAFTEMFDYESITKMQCPHVPAILPM